LRRRGRGQIQTDYENNFRLQHVVSTKSEPDFRRRKIPSYMYV
jgi:hypothetical protein